MNAAEVAAALREAAVSTFTEDGRLLCSNGHDAVWGHDGGYYGIYDGVIWWSCDECGERWHRFPEGDRRRAAVERVWDEAVSS